jgi:hypothetical protein
MAEYWSVEECRWVPCPPPPEPEVPTQAEAPQVERLPALT